MFCVSHTAPLNCTTTSLASHRPREATTLLSIKGAGVNNKKLNKSVGLKSGIVRSYLNISSSRPVSKLDKRRHVLIRRSDHRLITCCYSVIKAKTTSRLSARGARFIDVLLSKIVPWEEIPVSFDNFPYYTDEHTKSLLLECVASHLKQTDLRKYGAILEHSSNRIQLRGLPGTDLYREKLVSAVARELQVPLLKLDSSILPPYDISQHSSTLLEVESDDDSTDEDEDKQKVCLLKKGDRVKYKGKTTSIKEVKNRTLSSGHRGEVRQVKGDKVAVIFNDCGLARKEAEEFEKEEEEGETTAQEIVTWLDAKDVKRVDNAPMHDCFIALELLSEVLESRKPMIVYFPDTFYSILDEASCKECKEFFDKTRELINKLSGHVVLIYGQNEREAGSKETEEFTYIEELRNTTINRIFTNVMCINSRKDEDFERFFEDRKTVISEANLSLMQQVLKAHRLLCTDLEQASTTDMILTRKEVEKIVAWATNHYISSCSISCVIKEDLLHIPHESIKLAILRLTKSKETSVMPKKRAKDLAGGGHEEQHLVSSVICAGDIGVRVHVKFDDTGVLESVKKILDEKRIHLMIQRFYEVFILSILLFLIYYSLRPKISVLYLMGTVIKKFMFRA